MTTEEDKEKTVKEQVEEYNQKTKYKLVSRAFHNFLKIYFILTLIIFTLLGLGIYLLFKFEIVPTQDIINWVKGGFIISK